MLNQKILIIYFSHSGNTEKLAKNIQKICQADLISIEANPPYPNEYQETINEMSRQNKGNILPSYQVPTTRFNDYDMIFFGYPVWDMRLPPVMRSFLQDNSLNSQLIFPFNSHAGFGTGKSVNEIKELTQNKSVSTPLSIKDNQINQAEKEIENWVIESIKKGNQ